MKHSQKYSIAIVELDYHIECLYSLCNLFKGSGHKLSIFTKKNIYDEVYPVFRGLDYEWFVFDPGQEKLVSYLSRVQQYINKTDVLFYSTLESSFRQFNELEVKPFTILRIHNANTYLAPLKNLTLDFSIRYLWKALSYIVMEELFKSRSLQIKKSVKQADMLMFPDKSITGYVKDNFPVESLPPIARPLPMSFPSKELHTVYLKESEALRIVVPGSVDKRRRNYFELVEALKLIRDKIQRNVVVKLLGPDRGRYSARVRKKLRALENNFLRFEFSEGRVPQKVFIQELKSTHAILNPIRVETSYKIFKEVYGKTKISGAVTDVVRYQKPLIINGRYTVSDKLKGAVEEYGGPEELGEVILKLMEEDYLAKKNKAVEKLVNQFSRDDILNDFLDDIERGKADKTAKKPG